MQTLSTKLELAEIMASNITKNMEASIKPIIFKNMASSYMGLEEDKFIEVFQKDTGRKLNRLIKNRYVVI